MAPMAIFIRSVNIPAKTEIQSDPENEKLNITMHGASRPAANRVLAQLFKHLSLAKGSL